MNRRIGLLCIMLIFSPLRTVFSQTFDSKKLESLEQTVLKFEDKGYNGTILIAKGDNTIKTINTGFIDKSKKNAISNNTLFNIASIAKAFTAVSILQLCDRGLIEVNDPITKYLEIKSVQASEITIHHLLTHQSGLLNNYAADGIESSEAAINKIFSPPLKSSPGEGFIYSGNNYSLLAMIIEKVSQKNWEDFIQDNILNPLGMNSTIFWYQYHDSDYPKVIPNFKLNNKIKKRNYGYVGPTGIFSTAQDLVKLNRVFKMNTLLTNESVELLNKGIIKLQSEEPFDKNEYGYGLFIKAIGDKNIISLRGNEEGWGNAITYFFKENDVSIVVLSNVDELIDGKRPHIAVSQEIIKILE